MKLIDPRVVQGGWIGLDWIGFMGGPNYEERVPNFDTESQPFSAMLTAKAPARRRNADESSVATALEEDKAKRRKSMAEERKRRR
jgi:hypothetical protein